MAWDTWEHRNGILNDKEQGPAATDRAEKVKDEYEEGYEGLDRDARLLSRPGLEIVLRYMEGQQNYGTWKDNRRRG